MNEFLYLLLGIALLLLVVFRPLIRRRASAIGREVGTKAGQAYADGKLPAALATLGATLLLETDLARATEVVDTAVAGKPKRFRIVGPGTYTAKFMEHGDVQVRLVAAEGGARLQLESFRDYLKFPQGRREWDDLRERVTEAAKRAGVTVRSGETLTHERREQIDDNDWRWFRVDAV